MNTNLVTDPELAAYLPPLDRETKALLEDSIRTAGKARQPIEVWKNKGIIVDGHNRYEICTRLKLPFEVIELEFKDRKAAKQHMLDVQVTRRNLTKDQASVFRGQYTKMLRGKRAKDIASGKDVDTSVSSSEQAAKDTGVSLSTVKRDVHYADGVTELARSDPEEAAKVTTGKSMVNKAAVEKIGKAKTEGAKTAAVGDALRQATRKHRKEVTNRVTHLKPKPEAEPSDPTYVPIQDAEKLEQTNVVIEKLALFLSAKTFGGRRGQMKLIVKRMGELEGTEFAMPAEYVEAAPEGTITPLPKPMADDLSKAKAKTTAKSKAKVKAPPALKTRQLASDD